MDVDVAVEVELHEAQVWSELVEATGKVDGDPLGARVERSTSVPLPALTVIGAGLFNRVIGLGVGQETDADEVARILGWYADQGQQSFVVEATPVARSAGLDELLRQAGLDDSGTRQAKVWRGVAPPAAEDGPRVEELTVADRDEVALVNLEAWGVPPVLAPWFGATLGLPGFRHFGVRVDGRLVSTGALRVSDGLGWLGFGATRPEHRGKGMQTATMARRIEAAAEGGCRLVHTETSADPANASLHNMLRLGFEHLYDKAWYAPPKPTS